MSLHASSSTNRFDAGPLLAGTADGAGLAPVLRRRWVLVVGITAGCLAIAAIYIACAKPVYISEARLQVRPSASKSIDNVPTTSLLNGINFLSTQCEMIKSTPVLNGALKQLTPAQQATASDGRLADLRKQLTIEPGKKDDLIRVSVEAASPDDAAKLVGAIVTSYTDFVGQLKRNESQRMEKLLEAQKAQAQAEAHQAGLALQTFRQDNPDFPYDTEHGNIATQRLNSLSDAYTRDHLLALAAQSTYDSALETLGEADGPARCAQLYRDKSGATLLDRNRDELRGNVSQMKEKQAALKDSLMPGHPLSVEVQNVINDLQQQIDAEDHREATAYVAQLFIELQQAQQRQREDDKELSEQKLAVEKANAAAFAYGDLQASFARLKKQQDDLDERIQAVNVSKETGAMDVALVEPASNSDVPARPEPQKVLAVAAALGLMLGIGAAVRRDRKDSRLRSSQAIVAALDLPVIGSMPRLKKTEASARSAQGACQIIRRGINLMTADFGARTIFICPANRRTGATMLVRQLAASYSQSGKRVICVDASHPKSTSQSEGEYGWRDVLAGSQTLDAAVQKLGANGIDVLPAGGGAGGLRGTCLEESTIAPLLKQLSSRYQIVLIDGAVVSPLGEACMWASSSDATILVLRAGKADAASAGPAVQALGDVGANVIGVVVNRVSRGDGYGVLARRETDESQTNATTARVDTTRRRTSRAA